MKIQVALISKCLCGCSDDCSVERDEPQTRLGCQNSLASTFQVPPIYCPNSSAVEFANAADEFVLRYHFAGHPNDGDWQNRLRCMT